MITRQNGLYRMQPESLRMPAAATQSHHVPVCLLHGPFADSAVGVAGIAAPHAGVPVAHPLCHILAGLGVSEEAIALVEAAARASITRHSAAGVAGVAAPHAVVPATFPLCHLHAGLGVIEEAITLVDTAARAGITCQSAAGVA